MIIQCVSCLKKFEVEASQIPNSGRQVKCGVCSNEWFYKPADILSDSETEKVEKISSQTSTQSQSDTVTPNQDYQVVEGEGEFAADENKIDVFSNNEKTIDEPKIDFNDLDNEKEISKKDMDDTLDKIVLDRNLGSPMSDKKRKSSLIRARHLTYILFFLILILFVVSIPFKDSVLMIFPELGIIYEGVKPIYNLLFK
jgi:predicted Zn finger-like uncharacterized protein|tara:strand:- start:1116 stop:1709 length:594 start_codon:yes stop_codon:yes gene_type:complete